jgi:methyl-accepting chemotaxis protein
MKSRMTLLFVPGINLMRRLSLTARLAILGVSTGSCVVAAGTVSVVQSGALTVLAMAGAAMLYVAVAFCLELTGSLAQLRLMVEAIYNGDFRCAIEVAGRGEVASACAKMGLTTQRLSQIVARIRSESELVAMGGERLTASSRELAERTEAQAANLQQTAASVTQLNKATARNLDDARAVSELARQARAEAEACVTLVDQSVATMHRIELHSRQMRDIVALIEGIAFQTNILALNAAVESARAGMSGRGFSVVAQEVRMLAQRSAQAAADVRKLIDDSAGEVTRGVTSIDRLTGALTRVIDGFRQVASNVQTMLLSNEQQADSLQEISDAVLELDRITQSNAKMVDVTAGFAGKLHEQAGFLSRSVKAIQLRQGCADEARALVERAVRLIDAEGLAQAKTQFHARDGDFIDRDLFIFVLDRRNYFRAFGANPDKSDRPAVAAPGTDIRELCARIWRTADTGGGWIEYRAPHPVTGEVTDKIGYALLADGGRYAVMSSVNRSDE